MDFFKQLGKVVLGSRLRRLGELFTEDAKKLYALYHVDLQPKWFPVFYVLSQQEMCSITQMAKIIGYSHPVISQIVKEMTRAGLTTTTNSGTDARVNMVQLSEKGKAMLPDLEIQMQDVGQAVEELLQEMQYDLWKGIEEMEFLLAEKDFYTRALEKRKARESQNVEIIDYEPKFHEDFKQLNYEWIEQYFTLEETDRQSLEHPDEKILQPGGHILLARYQEKIVGTCALIKKDEATYELAKMAVTQSARGKNIGWLLGEATINKAREIGAQKVVLESNTSLKPAINLYYKLGFQKVIGPPSPYVRCNIQMELNLN